MNQNDNTGTRLDTKLTSSKHDLGLDADFTLQLSVNAAVSDGLYEWSFLSIRICSARGYHSSHSGDCISNPNVGLSFEMATLRHDECLL